MRLRHRGVWVSLALMALLGVAACQPAMEEEGAAMGSGVPRLEGTSVPDIHGVWQAFSEGGVQPRGAGGPAGDGAPCGGAQRRAGAGRAGLGAGGARRGAGEFRRGGRWDDSVSARGAGPARRESGQRAGPRPGVKCLMPGVPRATYMGHPLQITQGTDKIMLAYGFSNAGRTIHLDEVDTPGIDSWMGHSVGRWEGDTLVVEVTELMEQTWLDRSGNFHSGAMTVTERYTPVTPYHIDYEATITDPEVFTEPWTIKLPLYKRMEAHPQVLEFRCVEMVEELIYGHLRKDQLVEHWEGDYGRRGGTLVIDITRRPTSEPDL